MRLPELLVAASLLAAPTLAGAHQGSTTPSGEQLRWTGSCVYWTLIEQSIDNSGFPSAAQPLVSFEEVREAVRGAFSVWDEVDCSYLTLIETEPGHCMDVGLHRGAGNANRVFFRSSGWIDPDATWRVEGQIALTSVFFDTETGEILDVDIEVNAELFELTTTVDDPRTDIQNALAHEVGHLAGLDHSEVSDATMWFTAREAELDKRTLSDDDRAGICSIYPLDSDPGHCNEPSGGLDVDCETAETCTPPSGGVSASCWFDEPVCCCEQAGGLGRCSWTASHRCAEVGHHGILELDDRTACAGDSPGRSYTCCCEVGDDGAMCDWRPISECEEAAGLPAVAVDAEDLCGPFPRDEGCGCRTAAIGRGSLPRLAEALLSLLGL